MTKFPTNSSGANWWPFLPNASDAFWYLQLWCQPMGRLCLWQCLCCIIDNLWAAPRTPKGPKEFRGYQPKFLFPSSVDNQNIPFCSDNIVQMASGGPLGSKFGPKWAKMPLFGWHWRMFLLPSRVDTNKTLVCVNNVAQVTSVQP